jgi:hypothetical protein
MSKPWYTAIKAMRGSNAGLLYPLTNRTEKARLTTNHKSNLHVYRSLW